LDLSGSGYGPVEGFCEHGNEPPGSIKCWEVLEQLHSWQLLKKGSAPWVSELLRLFRRLVPYKNPPPETVKTKEKPLTVSDRATYMTLSPERTFFKMGLSNKSHSCKVFRKRWISHTYPTWLWDCRLLRISSPWSPLYGNMWLPRRPLNKLLQFVRSVIRLLMS
jgi:hypothetical protein